MTGGGPLGVGRLDGARGWVAAPEWRVWRRVAVARFCFFFTLAIKVRSSGVDMWEGKVRRRFDPPTIFLG
jgi:hypothetical protein